MYSFYIFSSPEPKAQDELLWSLSVRHPSDHPSVHTFEHFSSETPGPNFFKLYVEHYGKGGIENL